MMEFDDFLCEKNDLIDNAAHALICSLVSHNTTCTEDCLEWNMQHIGAVVMLVERYLAEQGMVCCHPFYEGDDEVPCYRCAGVCEKENCPFKQ